MLNQQQTEAIDEINGDTWVDEGIRDRAKQRIRSGEHDLDQIMRTFRKISDRLRPTELIVEAPQLLRMS